MSLYTLTDATTPDGVLIGISSSVPVLPIMILVFTWFFIFITGARKQADRTGDADVSQWALLSSVTILILSLIMTITAGLLTLPVLIIVVSITILTAVWFFLSRGRIE